MSTQFTLKVLSYCLGQGTIALKGKACRPWLELSRIETERSYLEHQLRALRRLHPGPLEAHWDRLPGKSFYDIERLRIHSDLLWRPYELLYPRDQRTITPQLLAMSGFGGLVGLWGDRGRAYPRSAELALRAPGLKTQDLEEWCQSLGHPALVRRGSASGLVMRWGEKAWPPLARALRAALPECARASLRPPR
jgi:hypothetical protein